MFRQPCWQVWTGLALLIAAALACSVTFSTAHLENAAVYRDPGGEIRTRSFGPDDAIYCLVDLKDTGDEALEVRMILKQVMTLDDTRTEAVEITREERTSRSGRLTFTLSPTADGWQKGAYQVELYLDGDKKMTLDFRVK
jgi:hypothetical protein